LSIKTLRIMKISVFLLFATFLSMYAESSYSQNTRLSMNVNDVTVGEVLSNIEDQSEFYFLFSNKLVDVNRRVSLQSDSKPISAILNDVFEGTDVDYVVKDRQIILSRTEMLKQSGIIMQGHEIAGTVTDAEGMPLPGVNVLLKGLATGVITDKDGNYSIEVANSDVILEFSFIGYETKEIVVGEQTIINVILELDIQGLEEVVVIGYGTQKKSSVTGSIAVADKELVGSQNPLTAGEYLQGTVTGVQVTNSGDPGAGPIVRIRGVNSLVNNNPLYILDGIPVGDSRDFNPADIESISVLKDAAAASIYGSRAANGVILITTKKGKKSEKMKVEFNARYGVSTTPKLIELADAEEFAYWDNVAKDNANRDHIYSSDLILTSPDSVANSDWQDAFFKTAQTQDYNLAMYGGSDNITYRLSVGHLDKDAIIIGPKFSRNTFAFSSEYEYGKLKIGQNTRLGWSEAQNSVGGIGAHTSFVEVAWAIPTIPIYDEANLGGFGRGTGDNPTHIMNPIGMAQKYQSTNKTFKAQTNLYGEYKILPSLKFRVNVGLPYTTSRDESRNSKMYIKQGETESSEFSTYGEGSHVWSDFILNQIITFEETIGKHNITATLGMSYEKYSYSGSGGSGMDVIENPVTEDYIWTLSNVTSNMNVWGVRGGSKIFSYFARTNYAYDGKYLFSAVARVDQSSKFAPGFRTGFFPSVSGGWNIHREDFMQNSSSISNLKLFGGYGELGGNEVGDFDYMGYINTTRTGIFGANETELLGMIQTRLSVPGLSWQTVTSGNVGIDLGLFGNKLQLILEYYKSTTRDALLYADIPNSSGNESSLIGSSIAFGKIPSNIGDFQNTGLEATIAFKKMEGDFRYQVTTNLSTLRNEVLYLGENIDQLTTGVTNTMVGYPIGTYYVMQHDGIFQNEDEVLAHVNADGDLLQRRGNPGDVRWIDSDNSGILDSDDRVMLGSAFPKLDAGLNLSMEYKGLDARIFFFGQFGHEIYNTVRGVLESSASRSNYYKGHTPWTGEGTSNTIPRPLYGKGQFNFQASNIWIEKGDFVKLKLLEIGYTVPQNKLRNISIRVFAQGQNLFTISDYTGFDPEITNYGIQTRGVDWGSFPNPRSISGGVQIKF
jgi:TonB-dependent starch-binding outer membrane protein SusC